jgi:uncharacterized protein YycO
MKTIRIGFSRPKKMFPVFSWLIRLWIKKPYSHVYLGFDSSLTGRSVIYEAIFGGVRFVGSKMWQKQSRELGSYEFLVSDHVYKKTMTWCIDQAGVSYGFAQNLGIVLAHIFRLRHNPWKSGINCSELIGEILVIKGAKIEKDLDLLTPADIESAITALQTT